MKSFSTVYNSKKAEAVNRHRESVDADHAKLVAAIKREYSINDFSTLSESKRDAFKRIINEMWDRENGLNDKGLEFVNEAFKPLTEVSSDEAVDNYIIKSVKPKAEEIFNDIASGKNCEFLATLKKNIENDTHKKVSRKHFIELVGKVILPVFSKKLNALKF